MKQSSTDRSRKGVNALKCAQSNDKGLNIDDDEAQPKIEEFFSNHKHASHILQVLRQNCEAKNTHGSAAKIDKKWHQSDDSRIWDRLTSDRLLTLLSNGAKKLLDHHVLQAAA